VAILCAAGEDIEWPIIGSASVSTTAGRFRAGWARCAIVQTSASSGVIPAKTAAFAGGAITTGSLSCQYSHGPVGSQTNIPLFGLGVSGTNKFLGIGTDGSVGTRLVLAKYDGTTRTVLATETGTSLAPNVLIRFDMLVISFGATAAVTVYVNGVSIISGTYDTTTTGMTSVDCVFLASQNMTGWSVAGSGTSYNISEVFVADSDTRSIIGLQTLALTNTGTTNNWTNNTFSNINAITSTDTTPTFVNTTAKDQQYTVTTPTPVTYSGVAVIISGRLARPAAATPTQVKLGYGNGAAGAFGTGAAKTPGVGYSTFQQIDATNPVTGLSWTSTDLASVQLDLGSA
jgi:hypothetical protein